MMVAKLIKYLVIFNVFLLRLGLKLTKRYTENDFIFVAIFACEYLAVLM